MNIKFISFIISIIVLIYPNIFASHIKSASELDYPPFCIVDKNEKADGFSIDLLKAVTKSLDINISFYIAPWHEIKDDLKNKKIDVLPLVSYSEERDKYFDFTVPYLIMHGAIFVRKDNEDIRKIQDLKNKEVLVMKGDTAEEYAISNNISDHIILKKSYEEAFKLLSQGKHDAIIVQELVGFKLINDLMLDNIKALTLVTSFKNSFKPISTRLDGFVQKFCFAVYEGNQDLIFKLNEGLQVIVNNGTYDKIYQKWFPIYYKKTNVKKLITNIILIIIPIIIILLILGNIFLRKEVANKTKELQTALSKANETNEMKTNFLMMMSHEIRTPLNGIKGFTDIMLCENLSKNQLEYMQTIKNSTDLLMELLNDILDLSTIESGKIKFYSTNTNIIELIDNSLKRIQILISLNKSKIKLNKEIDLNVPEIIFIDQVRLQQILNNFLFNAYKFTEEGEISISAIKLKTNQLEIAIKDTGCGIPKNKLEIIFEPFRQIDMSSTRKYGGIGLGLSINKKLIHLMGGSIKAESIPGYTIFTFIIPYKTPEKINERKDNNINIKKDKKTGNILVAEDDLVSQKLIQIILSKHGFNFELKDNGIDTFEAYINSPKKFDLILMDWQMPDLNGLDTVKQIRSFEKKHNIKNIPIISLTAAAMKSDRKKCIDAGCTDYMTKPVNQYSLIKLLYNYIK